MNQQLQEAWAVLTADKKKATVLGVLAVLAVAFWIRAAVTSGPAKATASTSATTTKNAKKTSKKNGSTKRGAEGDQEVAETITLKPVQELHRDLFALSDALLASSAQMEQDGSDHPKSTRRNDDKTVRAAPKRVQTVEERVQEEAMSLRLRSTMIGANPIAVIETADSKGHVAPVVRVGDRVAGFVLRAVRAQEVDLEKNGIRVTLSRLPDEKR